MHTKNGKPLQVVGDYVYSKTGAVVGRIQNGKVFGPNGRYVGSIDQDRLVYRSTESAGIGGSFSTSRIAGSAMANATGLAIWGDEPTIPE